MINTVLTKVIKNFRNITNDILYNRKKRFGREKNIFESVKKKNMYYFCRHKNKIIMEIIMKKRIFIACMLFCGVVTAFGQITDVEKTLVTASTDTVSGWKFGTVVGINFSQTELVNWAAGGQSSLAFNGIFSASANYLKDKNS